MKEKNCFITHYFNPSMELLKPLFILCIVSYITSFFQKKIPNLFASFEFLIYYPIFWIVMFITILTFSKEFTRIKTDKGKEIYLKLNGLKNYINNFGNFDDKELKEIALWDEYILYAMILDESKNLSKQALEELKKLIKIVYK